MRLRQREDGANIRPIIVEFRSEYDKWTVMRMKAKLRECEDYRRVLELDLWREEREVRKARILKLRKNAGETTGVNGSMVSEKRSLIVV